MSEHDKRDPKPANGAERAAIENATSKWIVDRIGPQLAGPLHDLATRMYREGVIAGLRVHELLLTEPTLVVQGKPADLLAVQPGWCDCPTESGQVCSPRRRPANCDTVMSYDVVDDCEDV